MTLNGTKAVATLTGVHAQKVYTPARAWVPVLHAQRSAFSVQRSAGCVGVVVPERLRTREQPC